MAIQKIRLELSVQDFTRLYSESSPDSFLRAILDSKVDAMAERENYYIAYKSKNATPEQKEQARKEYMKNKGIAYH